MQEILSQATVVGTDDDDEENEELQQQLRTNWFKVRPAPKDKQPEDPETMTFKSNTTNTAEGQLDDIHFVSLRIKHQYYCGKRAIVFYIRDRTKKVRERIFRM